MARQSATQKGRDILSSKTKYPEFNVFDYDRSICEQLTFYRLEVDDKVKKHAAITYWKSMGKDVSRLSRLGDGWFATVGAVAHIISRDITLDDRHVQYLNGRYESLLKQLGQLDDVEKDVAPVAKIVPRVDQDTDIIAEALNGVDTILAGNEFDIKAFLVSNEVKPATVSKIITHAKGVMKELNLYGVDEQVTEAYEHLGKRGINAVKKAMTQFVSDCESSMALNKVARKPRKMKAKPASVIAKKVIYQKEWTELKLKSVLPEKMVNAGEIWVVNTKLRRLYKYVAIGSEQMTVKGTTIIGFDPAKSGGKILRKPEEQLKGVESLTTRSMNKLFNDINATMSKATGRINGDTLILKTF